jgi:AraC-like DNA-binding protein
MASTTRSAQVESAQWRGATVWLVGGDHQARMSAAHLFTGAAQFVRHAESLSDVPSSAEWQRPSTVVMVDSARSAHATPAAIRTFREVEPLCVVVYCKTSMMPSTTQRAMLARAGLDAAFCIDSAEDTARLQRYVSRVLATGLPWPWARSIVTIRGDDAQLIHSLCIRRGHQPTTADSLSAWLQWDRKTIHRKLARAGYSSLRSSLSAGRLLHAAYVLDQYTVSVGMVARRLEFASVSTLHRLCVRLTGHAPSDLRAQGAIATALQALSRHPVSQDRS